MEKYKIGISPNFPEQNSLKMLKAMSSFFQEGSCLRQLLKTFPDRAAWAGYIHSEVVGGIAIDAAVREEEACIAADEVGKLTARDTEARKVEPEEIGSIGADKSDLGEMILEIFFYEALIFKYILSHSVEPVCAVLKSCYGCLYRKGIGFCDLIGIERSPDLMS